MSELAPRCTLNDGRDIPQIGLGTWPMDDAEAERVVSTAIEHGYRHIDTAVRYQNETGVGRGIAAAGVARAELFVTTKVNGQHQAAAALDGIRESLDRLNLDYVDLLLIHWPIPAQGTFVQTWETLVQIRELGLARSIGVSNFKPAHLDKIIAATSVTPAVNQIQVNPYIPRVAERAVNDSLGIRTESWSPLGVDTDLLVHPTIAAVAAAHGRTPGQVVLRWHVQQGLVAIPKTVTVARLRENLDVFDFELTADDFAAIATLDGCGPEPGVDSDVHGH